MMFALVRDGAVVQLFTPPEGVAIEECFAPSVAAQFVAVPDGTTPAQGWTYVSGVFEPPVPPTPPPPTADEVLTEKIAAGITITSTGNPALNGTYALDAVSTAQIYQIGLFASQLSVFPSGTATQAYPDASGIPHTFSVAEFVAFLRAVALLVSALTEQAAIMAHGGTPIWPAQTATIQ